MDSLFAGLTTLSLNPAHRLEKMREERTVTAMRMKMDPRFATSRAAIKARARAQRMASSKPRKKVNS